MAHETILPSYTGVMLQDVIKPESTSQSSRRICTASPAAVVIMCRGWLVA